MDLKIIKTDSNSLKPRPKESELGFGIYTTDHMFLMDYDEANGWHHPRITPYQPLQLDPAAMVLHYNQEVFEGLKAYHIKPGKIGLFRPKKNINRFNDSARRMVMPEVNPDLFLEAMNALIQVDADWLPKSEGTSLYIRPTMIATEAALGVKTSKQYLFYIILSPVGAYYPEGFSPTRIFVSDEYVRAVQGGAGEAKTSCNYGPTLYVSQKVSRQGYTQVLWLDAKERKYVEEVGTSNVFFLINDELVTPPLSGTILAGVTRDSVIQLAQHWGLKISERMISIDEVVDACDKGTMNEMFASGTAAVISPVGEIGYKGKNIKIGDGATGKLAQRFYDEITGIQNGVKKDPFNWRVMVV
jgi:branched-chain amino acid aminotransferase